MNLYEKILWGLYRTPIDEQLRDLLIIDLFILKSKGKVFDYKYFRSIECHSSLNYAFYWGDSDITEYWRTLYFSWKRAEF